jgi:RNA polymerase sigma-70 factor (ECF subfamily)
MSPDRGAERLSQISTAWTLLRQIHGGSAAEARAAQELLLLRYRGAVYRYLRKAVGDTEAEDLTQEFGLQLLAGKFHRADPHKGRFRDYVRAALFHLVAKHRRQTAKRSRTALDRAAVEELTSGDEANRLFDAAWRDELLNRTWQALRQVQPDRYEVLHFRAQHPDLSSEELAQNLGTRLGRKLTPTGVRQILHRARGQFAGLLLEELRHSLDDPTEANLLEELGALGLLDYCRPALGRRNR